MAGLFVVTNVYEAAARLAPALPGVHVLPWLEMLHAGPVPTGLPLLELSALRARWLTGHLDVDPARNDAMFRRRDARLAAVPPGSEVAVFVEHHLHDQLCLIQVLAELEPRAGEVRLTLAQADDFPSQQEPEELAALFAKRGPIGADVLQAAREAWAAFRAPTPELLVSQAGRPFPGLPWLPPALRRLLEELPDAVGLTRTERTALEILAAGPAGLGALFEAVRDRETPGYVGHWTLFRRLEELATPPEPLVDALQGRFGTRAGPAGQAPWVDTTVRLTDAGRAVLAGRRDRLADRPPDRWQGGVHLRPGNVWRWDHAARRLTRD